jgi:predicted hydrocarbon binding protein
MLHKDENNKNQEECKVKGSSIKAVLRYMEVKWGKIYVSSLRLSFSPEEIKTEAYYPHSWIRELHKKIIEKSSVPAEKALRKMGADVVKSSLEGKVFINHIVKHKSIESIFNEIVRREYINIFEGDVKRNGKKTLIRVDQKCEDRSEEICWIMEGAIEALIKASKKHATVKHTKCMFHGDDHCIFEVLES